MINKVKHLAYVLKIPLKELLKIAETPDQFYYEKKELKRNKDGTIKIGKDGEPQVRILYPSLRRLKEIQKRINKSILQTYECFKLPEYAFGAVKGRDNINNARAHQGKKHNFTTDLKSYFPSISHKLVFAMFRSKGFSPSVSKLLTELTTYKGQLPQGAPTSPVLANLVFLNTGLKLQAFCIEHRITFTSFIDDLTFSSPTDFQKHHSTIIDIIKSGGFKIAYPKTHYRTKNPVVTGIIVKNNNLDTTSEFKLKLLESTDKSPEQQQGLQQYRKRILNA